MSISFYVKNKKKFLGYEPVLNVETALSLLDKELNVYGIDGIDINDLLLSPLSNYQCLIVGTEDESARGFELAYDNKNKVYAVRVFTPSSREDWLLALEYIKALAKKMGTEIVNERGETFTVDNIGKFDYESDILYGIKVITENIKSGESSNYIIFGVTRPVSFDEKMIDEINNSDSPIDTFSRIVRDIQNLDAYSANQQFYENREDGTIMGAYTITERVRTIIPYKPSVEFHNSDIVRNDDIAFWNITFVVINGDENDRNSYQPVGRIAYDEFIKKLPKEKYKFIDASYIMVEPLTKEEISDFLK
ncbi:DUF4299 family protein [Fusobacterium pseudoperiodonticum]|uniref:DUF4299 domain-containing protein n=1 Tax=Fusobacterium pseudoperiodonticum TaxID=2663009 RepID=A0A2D3NSK1_9FUSO|nr:DUF4299 family protein [Fusobacterium pseudoperiodonticum]ATV58379.1 hypothetical protein CTM72_00670 [Fusobacterium pseudoperiodonticum]